VWWQVHAVVAIVALVPLLALVAFIPFVGLACRMGWTKLSIQYGS